MSAQQPTVKKVNKMTLCVRIMRQLINDKTPTDTQATINKKFKQAVKEHPDLMMSVNGANTYCSNVTTFINGGDPYRHNKAANQKRAQLRQAAAEHGIPYIETELGNLTYSNDINLENRWWVVNQAEHRIIETHTNQRTANKVAKALSVTLADKKLIIKAA